MTGQSSLKISKQLAAAYWRANLKLMFSLLLFWFFVSFGVGILFVDWMNQFTIGTAPLGFWFAQQGSIYAFVLIIFIYVRQMAKLEKKFGLNEPDHNHASEHAPTRH